MRMLFAPDSFKGSLTSKEQIEFLTKAATKVFPGCDTVGVSMADGGEGTLSAMTESLQGSIEKFTVHGPLSEPVCAEYGVLDQDTVILEMAQMSGLTLVPEKKRNPLYTSSVGTGEMIAHVLEQGFSQILLAIGGSATNDGGIGAARALGVRFMGGDGRELEPCGKSLRKIRTIDDSGLMPQVRDACFTIMCDVDNPLLGRRGATYVYGPQKGAYSKEMLKELEEGMENYNSILKNCYGKDYSSMPGAGAAGGISIPFLTFSNTRLKPGIQTVLDTIGFERMIEGVDLVVTGEGRVDEQSAYGKVLDGIGGICRKYGIPVVALCACLGPGYDAVYGCGIDAIFTLADGPMTLAESMERANELYPDAAERMFRFMRVGMRCG